MTSHYLNQLWYVLLMHICVSRPQWVKYPIHTWQVTLQQSYSDTCQIWMQYKGLSVHFYEILHILRRKKHKTSVPPPQSHKGHVFHLPGDLWVNYRSLNTCRGCVVNTARRAHVIFMFTHDGLQKYLPKYHTACIWWLSMKLRYPWRYHSLVQSLAKCQRNVMTLI